jgi:cbb3-type cytochrome oxidase cytochrome c subunit
VGTVQGCPVVVVVVVVVVVGVAGVVEVVVACIESSRKRPEVVEQKKRM